MLPITAVDRGGAQASVILFPLVGDQVGVVIFVFVGVRKSLSRTFELENPRNTIAILVILIKEMVLRVFPVEQGVNTRKMLTHTA